jgi:hypothetical protein
MNQDKIEIFKEDAIINIKFKRDFYHRLVLLLQSLYRDKTEGEMQEATSQIESKNIKEEWVFHYETMIYLIKASEEYAQQNQLTELVDLETYRQRFGINQEPQ